ncbi:unnamed protein product [Lasius platythorax]|uniref:Uncharacterized protein n=1 Tax=Lasius platythorax TaxID=488582 RepID=A0AAV2NRW3_9HYME
MRGIPLRKTFALRSARRGGRVRLVVHCERCSVAGGQGLTYRRCERSERRSFRQVNRSRKVTWRVTRWSQMMQPQKPCQRARSSPVQVLSSGRSPRHYVAAGDEP